MAKTVECEAFTFYDDGTNFFIKVSEGGSASVTAVMPTNGNTLSPVTIAKTTFLKAYRGGSNFSGIDGKCQLKNGHWKILITGAKEVINPEPDIVEGPELKADVTPLHNIPTEDSYGGETWAAFLPSGIAALLTTYSMAAMVLPDDAWPRKPIMLQANAIYPILNLKEPKVTVSESAVGIIGEFGVGSTKAVVYVALAKPTKEPPEANEVEAMFPDKRSTFSVSAHALRECIDDAKKLFGNDATNLTFTMGKVGLNVGLRNDGLTMDETIPYTHKPDKTGSSLAINTDIISTAFKAIKGMTGAKSLARVKFTDDVIQIRIVEDKKTIGGFVLARA